MKRTVSPFEVYNRLYKKFGPQGWWPTTRKGKQGPGYRPLSYDTKTENEKFEICLGAILTQNTSWKNVEKALVNLNLKKNLALKKIDALKQEQLAELIRPSGYFNQKAKRVKAFSSYVQTNYNGRLSSLFKKNTRAAREELLSLAGIGPETADSMLLFAANKPIFVVDAYTIRIGDKLGFFKATALTGRREKDYSVIQEYFHKNLPPSFKIYNEFHALLVELGKSFCRKKPLCNGCPLSARCAYYKEHKA